jgi:hypothetical protein
MQRAKPPFYAPAHPVCAYTDMPNLQWTVPVARWSSWPVNAAKAPDLGFIEPIVRRRLSGLSRVALKVAHDCAADREAVRVLFASRHGELRRTTDILHAMTAGEPVSPTSFSLSVLNAMTGLFGIARGDRSAAGAVSAGAATLGYALFEAHAQYAADPSAPVLMVYADEPADAVYGTVEHEVKGGALAVLLDASTAIGRLECSTSGEGRCAGDPGTVAFATQSEALLQCLEGRAASRWQNGSARWEWNWHDGEA